jgi:hypothetical protein
MIVEHLFVGPSIWQTARTKTEAEMIVDQRRPQSRLATLLFLGSPWSRS